MIQSPHATAQQDTMDDYIGAFDRRITAKEEALIDRFVVLDHPERQV